MHVIVTDCGAQEQLVAHTNTQFCAHTKTDRYKDTHRQRQTHIPRAHNLVKPETVLFSFQLPEQLYTYLCHNITFSFINGITSSFIHRYAIQSDRRGNAHTSGQISSNFLTNMAKYAKYAYLGTYMGAQNMVKWGIPEKILQNAVQTLWS